MRLRLVNRTRRGDTRLVKLSGTDIERWAELLPTGELPELVRRLIHGTVEPEQLERIDIPADEGISKHGFDGVVHARVGKSGSVPQGWSVWEMGCGKDFERKAKKDYKTRVEKPLAGIDPKQTTFVFVTPRRWPGGAKWANERRAENHWRDVLVLDADNLSAWLHLVPAVAAWFAELTDRPGPLQSLELRWREWSQATEPVTSEGLVLAGRDEARDELLTWLESVRLSRSRTPKPLVLASADADEVAAFCWATLRHMPAKQRDYWRERALVVSGDENLRRLALEPGPLLIVARDCGPNVVLAVAVQGHAVLANDSRSRSDSLVLPPLEVGRAQLELEAMGLTTDDALVLVRKLRGSLPGGPGVALAAIRQELGAKDAVLPPDLAPLLLAGAWTDSEQDVALVCEILGNEPARLLELERHHGGEPSSPLVRVGNAWRWSSRRAAWSLGRLVPADIDRFERVLVEVFDKERACSGELAEGLLEGLVLLAIESDPGRAEQIVSRLLGRTGLEHWSKFSRALASFVEAAPQVFSYWANRVIGDHDQQGFSWSWKDALEILAWSEEHLLDAADLLARFVEPERGSQIEAFSVLCEIFRPWHPQSSASLEARLAAFEALDRDHPRVAAELLWTLLPLGGRDHAMDTARPRYREWANAPEDAPTREDLDRQYDHMCERLQVLLREHPQLWLRILPKLTQKLGPRHRDLFLEQLQQLDGTVFETGQRETLREQLRTLIYGSRTSPSEWSLTESQLQVLEQLHNDPRIAPRDPRDALAWVFSIGPRILRPAPFDAFELMQDAFLRSRIDAARQLRASFTAAELVDYSHRVGDPRALAEALGRESMQRALELVESGLAHPDLPQAFWRGLGSALFYHQKFAGLQHDAIANLPPAVLAKLLLGFPGGPPVWDFVDARGPEVSRAYWRQTPPFLPYDPGDLERVVRAFLAVDRPWAAAQLAVSRTKLPGMLIVGLLDELGERNDEHDDDNRGLRPHLVGRLLGRLREDSPHDEAELQRLEWKLLSFLDQRHGDVPVALHAKLARDSDYYVQMVRLSAEESAGDEGHRANELLYHWHGLPGRAADKTFDGEHLRTWVQSARAEFKALGLGDAGDRQLGKVLARAPLGSDDRWPHEVVRNLIEGFGRSEQLATAIYCGRRNGRLAGFVDPARDQQQAERLFDDAKFMRTRWPRTADVLVKLADGSERDAKFWQAHGRQHDDWTQAATTTQRLEFFLDDIVAKGRYVFDFDEIMQTVGTPDLQHVLSTSRKVAAISDDAYVIVNREYRTLGAPPPEWYIDELMRRAGLRYCVALLSAAELHGAADQRPQVFQVLVDRPHDTITVGGQRIEFIARPRGQPFMAVARNTHTGTMLVATPEATVFDLAEFADVSGGRDHVVVVLEELGEEVDVDRLIETSRAYSREVVHAAAELLVEAQHDTLANHLLRETVAQTALGA